MIEVPQVVQNKARSSGALGERWLRDLPALVDDLSREWGLTIGQVYDGGTEAFVAAATMVEGTEAVLKLMVPANSVEHEITVLDLANGDGCARLFRHDLSRNAILMERLGPSLFDVGLPIAQRHEILCATAVHLWRPALGAGLPTGAEKGRWLIGQITSMWEELDHPCSARTIDHAVACAERRVAGHDDEHAVLVHGDVHQWNTLRAGDAWKLVDPDGLLADAEYDLGIIMREDPGEGDPRERAQWLAARTGLDETKIWEWGVVERVSTGLLCVKDGLQPSGDEMLAVADQISTQ